MLKYKTVRILLMIGWICPKTKKLVLLSQQTLLLLSSTTMHSGGSFYSDLSSIILFLHGASLKPVQEMILSGRFEILVTVFASRRDDNLLEYFLPIFERFYQGKYTHCALRY